MDKKKKERKVKLIRLRNKLEEKGLQPLQLLLVIRLYIYIYKI